MGPVNVADPIDVSAKVTQPVAAGRPVNFVIKELPPIAPVPAISYEDWRTAKVVLAGDGVNPVALAATVYVPGTSVLGPPVPAGEQLAAANAPGKLTVVCAFPLLSVVTVAVSQNGPPPTVGGVVANDTCTATLYAVDVAALLTQSRIWAEAVGSMICGLASTCRTPLLPERLHQGVLVAVDVVEEVRDAVEEVEVATEEVEEALGAVEVEVAVGPTLK